MSTGKSHNHKRKGHPGAFPEGSENVQAKNTDTKTPDEEGYLSTKEAFKNRVTEE